MSCWGIVGMAAYFLDKIVALIGPTEFPGDFILGCPDVTFTETPISNGC